MVPISSCPAYRGRYAPSPTGPLHLGSLIAALASYLDARQQGGQWLLRMEDLDPPREMPGAATAILRTLETYGFAWDGPVVFQSQRQDAYQSALEQLQRLGWAYPCGCSRKEIQRASQKQGVDGPVYPGTCRGGLAGRPERALRVRTQDQAVIFHDRVQGKQSQVLSREVGDFPLLRADGYFAYQLAVVVDDAWQGVTDVVRGCDLLDSTARQIYLQQLLEYSTPRYLHVPVALNAQGEKLSKQTYAPAIPQQADVTLLWQCLRFLGQEAPQDFADASLEDFWQWSVAHWNSAAVPAQRGLPAS